METLIGQRLGQFEIVAFLGEGGMAGVYHARQLDSEQNIERDVAIKIIKPHLIDKGEFIQRFEREAYIMASLDHRHIVKLVDYGQHEDAVYLVMDLYSGGSLAGVIRQGPLPVQTTSRLLKQIASALDYAHQRAIIHRDLKPHNVLLDEGGNAHLTDFGIAKLIDESTVLTHTGITMGTPAYMSPEQWQGKPLDARTDLYALGVILFEMLTGRLPFNGDTPASLMYAHISQPPLPICALRPDLPPGIEEVFCCLLAKDPAQRFASAGELVAAYRDCLRGKTPHLRSIPPPSPADSPQQRKTTVVAVENTLILEAKPQSPLSASRSGGLRPLMMAVSALLVVGVAATGLFSLGVRLPWSPGTPVASGVDQPPASQPAPMTLAAATFAQTANVTLSQTPTPTSTTNRVATETANAVALLSKTPRPTFPPRLTLTSTATPTSTLRPIFPVTATAQPGGINIDLEGVVQVWVPAGCSMMGSDLTADPAASSSVQLTHEVCLTHSYWIDQDEVTNISYQKFVEAGGYTLREYWSDAGWQWLQSNHIAGPENTPGFSDPQQPRVGVSWYEAEAYARWRGGRLPTESEWEYAARGPHSPVYPWGDSYHNGNANLDERQTGGKFQGRTVRAGSYESGKSWVGAYDMVGNVWEWVADWYVDTGNQAQNQAQLDAQMKAGQPSGVDSGIRRVLRGGSWQTSPAQANAAARTGNLPGIRSLDIGFRVVLAAPGK